MTYAAAFYQFAYGIAIEAVGGAIYAHSSSLIGLAMFAVGMLCVGLSIGQKEDST